MADWHQSYMFSSTAQILEVYLEPSPLPSDDGSGVMRWTPIDLTLGKGKLLAANPYDTISYPVANSSNTSPGTSTTNSSPASSPATSYTAYTNENQSPKKNTSSEIRRRRLPDGVEPRVKNLALTKSNGATKPLLPPPVLDAALTGTSSNYNHSPPMDSPIKPRPSPPPKAAARAVQQKLINRKPIQTGSDAHPSPSVSLEVDIFAMGLNNPFSQEKEQLKNIPKITSPKAVERPPRTTSLNNSQPPVVGRRPVPTHKKTLSTASSNKDLPPDPPIDRSLLPQKNPNRPAAPKRADTLDESRVVPNGLPSGPKLKSTAPVGRRPIPEKQDSVDQLEQPVAKSVPRGLALGSLASGPKPQSKPTHQVSNSMSSLTSATVSGPVPLPDFQIHRRAESDVNKSSLRSHSRERSQPKAAPEELITIAMDTRPAPSHRPTQSQTSTRSDPSLISRSTTPSSQRSVSTAPTSISSLPDVPEVRTPLIAPEIKPSHFTCYTQHRPLVASSNHLTPILCMTCKQDADKMWGCGWCHLRICTGCKDALVEVRNDLKRMLDESAAGTLIIGKERIPMPPFLGENGSRSYGSDTSSIRSHRSDGPRPMYSRGPVFAPQLRHQGSMDSMQQYGGNRQGPYGPPRARRGPSPQRNMRNQPLDFIGMPQMQSRGPPPPRQQMPMRMPQSKPSSVPQSPNMSTPTFGPVSIGFGGPSQSSYQQPNPYQQPRGYQNPPPFRGNNGPQSRRPAPGPSRQQRFDDDDSMPPMLDLSLDAGAGPMAAGLRGLNLGGAPRPMGNAFMGNGPYPMAGQRPRART